LTPESAAKALDAVLGLMQSRFGERPGQRLNSLAAIGKRLADMKSIKRPKHKPAGAPSPWLVELIEADTYGVLQANLRGDPEGCNAFVEAQAQLHLTDAHTIVDIAKGLLTTHGIGGKRVWSWNFPGIVDDIATELHNRWREAEGIRPGDPGARLRR
jgi:hypothetical protein